MADTPGRPSSAAFQNSLTPIPIGLITPNPVTTISPGMGRFLLRLLSSYRKQLGSVNRVRRGRRQYRSFSIK
jgi:hypothetical protein